MNKRQRHRIADKRYRQSPHGKAKRAAHHAKWCHAHLKQIRAHNRKSLYGITDNQFQTLLRAQGKRCAICNDPLDFKTPRAFGIDHDHKTKQVRGILCHGCNAGIGRLHDRIDLCLAAAEYLRKYV